MHRLRLILESDDSPEKLETVREFPVEAVYPQYLKHRKDLLDDENGPKTSRRRRSATPAAEATGDAPEGSSATEEG